MSSEKPTPKGKIITNGRPTPKGYVDNSQYAYNTSRNKAVAETYESLAQQSINQYGLDIFFMPLEARTDPSRRDVVLGEMANKNYHNAHYMRVLMSDIQQLKGGENIYSKFGLIIEDTLTFFVTIKDFIERVGQTPIHSDSIHKIWDKTDTTNIKPEIQDIIYIPQYNSLYEINFAERYEFMAVGYSYGWMCYTKKFKFSTSDNIYIDKSETGGIGFQTGMEGDLSEALDSINEADINVARTEKTDIIIDPTETGFDTTTTPNVENDDMQKSAEPVKISGEQDLFGKW